MDLENKSQEIQSKKWFIYWSNAHHGPFSLLEVFAWTSKLEDLSDVLIWSEKQLDWERFDQSEAKLVIDQQSNLLEKESKVTELPILWRDWNTSTPPIKFDSLNNEQMVFEDIDDTKLTNNINMNPINKIKKSKYNSVFGLCVFLIIMIGLFAFFYLKFSRPIRPIGLSSKDFNELLLVQDQSLTTEGPKADVVLDSNDLKHPKFYLASNILENEKLIVEVSGIPSSLIGSFYFLKSIEVKVVKSIMTTPFLDMSSKGVPLGYYKVKIIYLGQKLIEKVYFLGGEKSENYNKELRHYHSRLILKTKQELSELKQIVESLDLQLSETDLNFEVFLSNRTSFQAVTNWKEFYNKWNTYQKQLQESLNLHELGTQKERDLLVKTFKSLMQIEHRIFELHVKQQKYAKNSKNAESPILNLNIESAQIHNEISSLKVVILEKHRMNLEEIQIPWPDYE